MNQGIFARFDNNFYSRVIFRYAGTAVLFLVTPFLFMQGAKDLALFFIIRSLVNLTTTFYNRYACGQNFYNKLINATNKNFFFNQWLFQAALLALLLAIVDIFLLYVLRLAMNFEILGTLELIFIFLWVLSKSVGSIFQHYFQAKKEILHLVFHRVFLQILFY